MKIPRQLFVLDSELTHCFATNEWLATWHGMVEMGIHHPPVPDFDVHIPNAGDYSRMTYRFSPDGNDAILSNGASVYDPRYLSKLTEWARADLEEAVTALHRMTETIRRLLIVMLATRNTVKTTHRDKLAARGIGRNKGRYVDTTYIKIGAITEHSSGSDGTTRIPHLRRGHIRNQRFGPGLSETRKIWIEPTFINVDQGWIAERKEYRLTT